jgi:hypothetical protein
MAKRGKKAVKKKTSAKKAKRKPAGKKPNGGQPTKYHKKYCKQIIEFFTIEPTRSVIVKTITKGDAKTEETEERPERLRFLSNFAAEIGVDSDTLLEWAEKHPKFSGAYARAKELQKQHLITCGLFKLFDGKFTKFTAINITDMKDKQEVAHSGGVSLGVAYHEANTDESNK